MPGVAMSALEFSLRLGCALLCGIAIGVERQWRQRTAGLRTYMLVAVGSALFVMLAALTPGESSPTRIAAQVVTGIGFLGAGVIMRSGLNVRGLNIASTIWCSSADWLNQRRAANCKAIVRRPPQVAYCKPRRWCVRQRNIGNHQRGQRRINNID